MTEDLFYTMKRSRLGSAVIINNLDTQQSPTKKDVEAMATVLRDMGFDVEIHKDLTSQGMNVVKRKITTESMHKDSNCFLLLVISHGTADNFLLDKDGNKTWNLESLVTEICDVQTLVGKPKLFFIEACRGKEQNHGNMLMSKSAAPAPQQSGITLPSKQDVFVGFATVPGYVSLTSSAGSPYLQALATELGQYARTTDLSDIHLLVKRKLAGLRLGDEQVTQGAEERSSLLSKLLFARYNGNHKGSIKEGGKSWSSIFSKNSPNGVFKSSSSSLIDTGVLRNSSTPSFTSLDDSKIKNSTVLSAGKPRPSSELYSFRSASPVPERPRSILFSSPSTSLISRSSSSPSTVAASSLRPSPEFSQTAFTKSTDVYRIEVNSSDVEGGLNLLMNKVKEVYGGEGKVKIKKKNKEKLFSFKYKGPERAAKLLESALQRVRELQSKSTLWKFTQTLEVTTLS